MLTTVYATVKTSASTCCNFPLLLANLGDENVDVLAGRWLVNPPRTRFRIVGLTHFHPPQITKMLV